MAKPRALTKEEMRQRFLEHCWHMIDFWDKEFRAETVREKLSGVVFSVLSALDGCAGGVPGCTVTPRAHPDDKAYHVERGENWVPDDVDIAGGLHELFHKFDPSPTAPPPLQKRGR